MVTEWPECSTTFSGLCFCFDSLRDQMTRKRDRFWEYAEQLSGRFKCKFCRRDFPGGIPRVKSHLACVPGRDIATCTEVPKDVQAIAFEAISPHNRKDKSLSQPTTSTPLADIQIIDLLETSTEKGQDCLDELLAKHVVFNNISENVLQSSHFASFLRGVANYGQNYELPSYSVLTMKHIPKFSMEAVQAFLNIILYSLKGAILVNTVELLKNELTYWSIVDQLQFAMDEIGLHKVVQFITNDLGNHEPLRKTLIQKYPAISYLYEAMERVKESLERLSDSNDGKYECIWKLYNGIRAKVIHPVHVAAAFLNPSYFLSDNFHESKEMKDGIDYVLQNMVVEEEQEAFMGQVLQYRKRASNLLTYAAKTMSKAFHPYEWWEYCGDSLPILQNDSHDDYVELEKDWKYYSPNTVPESSSPGDIDGANTEWFPVPKLPALKEKPFILRFMTSMPPHLFTEAKVQGHQGTAIQVALLNPETGEVVQSGPGSTAELKIVVFDVHIHGTISEAFTVEDSHGEFAKKRFPLLPCDYVWRLVGIAMGGQVHKQLTGAGIVTVRDFLSLLSRDQLRLRNITGSGISDSMWKHTLEHAKSFVSDAKQYVYYCDEGRCNAILFNWNYELKGLICNGQFLDMGSLSSDQKIYLESTSKIAYQNYDQISEYCADMFNFDSMTSSNSVSAFPSDNTTVCYVGYSFGNLQNLQQFVSHEAGNIENCLQATASDSMSSMWMAAHSASMTSHLPVQGSNRIYEPEQNWKPRKAAVAWLKLKAAFRWGITIRKMAATRRAKELECLDLIIPLMLQP
ncbi:hypothetical protein NL676_007248 [Syzygium grande]|nr:hypothetical protein NL676_007248 [Syzygium grande]